MKKVVLPENIRLRLSEAIHDGQEFALFRFPGQSDYHLADENGYSVRLVKFGDSLKDGVPVGANKTDSIDPETEVETTDSNSYLDAVKEIADYHKQFGGKTVLSRIISGTYGSESDALKLAEKYFAVNPDAFCSLVYTRPTGLWVIATPELLLSTSGSFVNTVALAGTREWTGEGHRPWDKKNIDEQAVVTRFILKKWKQLGLDPEIASPITLRSNNVEHLCTQIKAVLTDSLTIDRILDATAPTPAVCGEPSDIALKHINRFENHRRELYGGYILVDKPDGSTEAYVILRCAKFFPSKKYAIYVGGGITGDSKPENELIETELKAQTLLKLLDGGGMN